ncbi:uracil-DNA glycosylase-like [Mya arenaria]|uniref:uracil-DNA glycosylase-like n=1 Tax=Mya arenaria TaxID=6604 RepID=UPI0022E16FC3|nr:uracil-DNA glycosylase-like [Mya arenaria]
MPPKRKAAEVSKSQPASKKSKVTTKKKQVKVSKAKTKDTKSIKGKKIGKNNAKGANIGKGKKEVKQVKAEPQKLSQAKHVKTSTLCLKDLLKNDEWKAALFEEFSKDYFKEIEKKLAAEYADKKQVFPPQDLIFNAFHLTPLDKVKVVILGQDPYHDDGQAMGMSFSVPLGVAPPPSLKNIYTELERDPGISGFKRPNHGCLEAWAKEGILMINATLTVEAHKPNSHAKFGWQTFTDHVIKTVSEKCPHVVFIFWGNFAHKKASLVDSKKHEVIKTAHPSPLSIKYFKECNCFSDCDKALKKFGMKPINWSL